MGSAFDRGGTGMCVVEGFEALLQPIKRRASVHLGELIQVDRIIIPQGLKMRFQRVGRDLRKVKRD